MNTIHELLNPIGMLTLFQRLVAMFRGEWGDDGPDFPNCGG